LRAQSVLGGRVRLLGSTAPGGVVGARVTLQRRLSDGRFVSIRSTRARRLTAFRAAYSFTIRRRSKSSVYRVVVTPAADSGQLQGTSRPRRVSARHT
jgi:hypothetical protein